jgi:hypothetical protein
MPLASAAPADEKPQFDESEYDLLINKLQKLLSDYSEHLVNASEKSEIVMILRGTLKDEVKKPSECVASFYMKLNEFEGKLKEHRDPAWKRFVMNALVLGGILISGILPGLIALSIYVNTGNKTGKSMLFWESRGAGLVKELKAEEPKVSDESNPKPHK